MGLYLLLFPRYMAILSKIANFSHPVYAYFAPPGSPWNWVPALGVKKKLI